MKCQLGLKSLLLLLVATLVSGCSKNETKTDVVVAASVVHGILTETVKTSPEAETLDVMGTVRARTNAVVSTRIPGTISLLNVREGDRVRKGQVLIKLDAQENQATAAVATAAIEEASRSVDEAKAKLQLAETTFGRYQKLLNSQVVSRQDFDIKATERELAIQAVSLAQAHLKQAQASSLAAKTISDYTKIVAPISGIITSKQVDLGGTVFPAQPLMTIEDEGSYQLELPIPESFMTKVKIGSTVQVTLDAIAINFSAKIAEIVPSADSVSRTFIAKINLNQQKGLKSGMFGRGYVSLGTVTNSITIPQKAVVEHGALTYLWIVDKQNYSHIRLVKVGKTLVGKVQILSGLSDGERVVISNVEKVSEGAKVE